MMAPIWAWARLDLRRRWPSLILLLLLTALSAATVLTAAAGAHRGGTAVDRLRAVTLPADVFILPNERGFDWTPVERLPYVEALAELAITDPIALVGDYDPTVVGYPPVDDELLRTIEKPVVLEGRVYDPTRADEVVVTPGFVDRYDKSVGDTLTLALAAPNQVDFDPVPAERLKGPRVPITIVGVVRSPWNYDLPGRPGLMLVSPALTAAHPENIIGPSDDLERQTVVNAQARLTHGAADIPRLRKDLQRLTGRGDIDVWDIEAQDRVGEHTAVFEAACLWVFAGAALLAALFLVGQALSRHVASSLSELTTARALGMSPRQVVLGCVAAPVLAVCGGLLLALGACVLASQWFPLGAAAAVEPDPGVDVDVLVLGGGALMILALLGTIAVTSATVALRHTRGSRPARSSRVADLVRGSRLPVPMAVGTRFALESGRGRTAVPARSALLGAVIGVVGVVGVVVFDGGIDDAIAHPERVGQTSQVNSYIGFGGLNYDPSGHILEVLQGLDYVDAVLDTQVQVASDPKGTTSINLYSHDGEFPTVVLHGRMPESDDELALAPKSLETLGADVGDTIRLVGSGRPRPMTVVGEALMPETGATNDYDDGGWVSEAGYARLFSDFNFRILLIQVTPSARTPGLPARMLADVDRVIPGLADQGFTIDPPDLGDIHATLERTRTLPRWLGLFLALLACGALGHALVLAVRRRSGEIAVLRALGMTPGQSRGVIATQATVMMLVGVAFGLPLGLAFGRTLWRAVARYTPLEYVPPTAVDSLLLVALVALVAANLMAAIPALRAARLRVSTILRTE
jgi:hypothetical protein